MVVSWGKWRSKVPVTIHLHSRLLLLFTDLIPLDQRPPLPPQWGWGGAANYIIYIGNGQGSVGTPSCLIRENEVTGTSL